MADAAAAAVVARVGAVHTVHVYRDRFYRAGSVRSVDHAGAFGPEVARRSVAMRRRRTADNVWPRYLGQLGPADEIPVRGIGTWR